MQMCQAGAARLVQRRARRASGVGAEVGRPSLRVPVCKAKDFCILFGKQGWGAGLGRPSLGVTQNG